MKYTALSLGAFCIFALATSDEVHSQQYVNCTDPNFPPTWDPVYTYKNYAESQYDTISLCDGSIISKIEIWTGKVHIGGLRFTVTYYPADDDGSSTGVYMGQYVVGTPGSDASAQILDLENGTIEETSLIRSNGGDVVSGFYVKWTNEDGEEQETTLASQQKNGTSVIATPQLGKLVGVKTAYDENNDWLNDIGFIFMHEPDDVATTTDSPVDKLDDDQIETVYDAALCQRVENGEFSKVVSETFAESSEQTWTEEQSITSIVGQEQTIDVTVEAGIKGASSSVGTTYTFFTETEQAKSTGNSITVSDDYEKTVEETVSWPSDQYNNLVEQYTENGTIDNYEKDNEGDYIFCYNVFVQWGEASVSDLQLDGQTTFYYGDRANYVVDVMNDYSGTIRSTISDPATDIASVCYDSEAITNCAGLPQTLP